MTKRGKLSPISHFYCGLTALSAYGDTHALYLLGEQQSSNYCA